MADTHQVVIIGSGPAGYTAAVYAGRANLDPILLTGLKTGGQLVDTTEVENYPPFPKGIQGPELMDLFREHATRFSKEVIDTHATKVDLSKRPFHVEYEGGELLTKSVIIATGATAKWLGIPSEQHLKNKGVSACATCDGFFFRGKEMAVVGGGDTAIEEATFLSKLATKVYLIHRRDSLRASKIMQDRAKNNPKIEFVWNSAVDHIIGSHETGVTGVRVKNVQTNETREFPVAAVFVAIGHQPNTELFQGQLDMDAAGYLKTVPGTTRTSIPGVFACGDVQDSVYRQAVTAAGTGCMAAIDAERWLAH